MDGNDYAENISPFQVDEEAVEEFNLTSVGDLGAIKSLVLGRVQGKDLAGKTIPIPPRPRRTTFRPRQAASSVLQQGVKGAAGFQER